MRTLLIFFFATILTSTMATPCIATNSDVLVVMRIDGLNDEMVAKLSAQIGKQRNYTLEYSCVSADIVVLRMNDVVASERGDAVTLVRRLLSAAGIEKGVEFLHLHLEPRGVNKC